jgi:hypothetical protein
MHLHAFVSAVVNHRGATPSRTGSQPQKSSFARTFHTSKRQILFWQFVDSMEIVLEIFTEKLLRKFDTTKKNMRPFLTFVHFFRKVWYCFNLQQT